MTSTLLRKTVCCAETAPPQSATTAAAASAAFTTDEKVAGTFPRKCQPPFGNAAGKAIGKRGHYAPKHSKGGWHFSGKVPATFCRGGSRIPDPGSRSHAFMYNWRLNVAAPLR